ncbi:hypothetical protein FRC03_003547 [Tulasnella sp. 419]|nr:hypothetical protein FRC03_003547 [Tulasnella sp. 419]
MMLPKYPLKTFLNYKSAGILRLVSTRRSKDKTKLCERCSLVHSNNTLFLIWECAPILCIEASKMRWLFRAIVQVDPSLLHNLRNRWAFRRNVPPEETTLFRLL